MEQTRKSPRAEDGTQTFSKEFVVTVNDGTEIAVADMSITTLHSFRKEHIEALLSEFTQISRMFYLEAGDALKTDRHVIVFKNGKP